MNTNSGFCVWCDKVFGEDQVASMRPIICNDCKKIPAAESKLRRFRQKMKRCLKCGDFTEFGSTICPNCKIKADVERQKRKRRKS